MANPTEKKQLSYYNLSEIEKWLEDYAKWYAENHQGQPQNSSNPGTPPPPPPGTYP